MKLKQLATLQQEQTDMYLAPGHRDFKLIADLYMAKELST